MELAIRRTKGVYGGDATYIIIAEDEGGRETSW